MIKITNLSDEDYEIIHHIDPHAPGCRVLPPVEPTELPKKQTIVLMGYEPGVSLEIRPRKDFVNPRSYLSQSGDG